jgi:outer membrane lipoprotein LolB
MKCFIRRLWLRQPLHICALRELTIILFSVFVLSACVTIEKHQLPPGSEISQQAAWEVRRANIQAIQTWKLKGRVAGKSNNQGFRAGVQWKQMQDDFVIDLHGPLGRKVAVITGTQENFQLKTSKGESFQANDPEELMQRLFGYTLPVNGLQHWLLGIPDSGQAHASLELDDQGRLQQLNQAGWVIDYKRYHDGTPALPALIQISNPTLNANIKVDAWMLGSQVN